MARHVSMEIVRAIKDYILEDVDKEETVSELRRYRKEFRSVPDYNWYRYGNILPYCSQIRDFYAEHDFEASEDNEDLCTSFCKCVGKAIDLILEENGADNAGKPVKKYNRNKIKYTCPDCGAKVRGKSGLHIVCGDCGCSFEEETEEEDDE